MLHSQFTVPGLPAASRQIGRDAEEECGHKNGHGAVCDVPEEKAHSKYCFLLDYLYDYTVIGLAHSLFVFVEEHSGPAGYKPRIPGEPQKNQQNEDGQHTALSEAHPAQLLVLIFDHLVCLPVTIFLCATSKGLSEAEATRHKKKDSVCTAQMFWYNKMSEERRPPNLLEAQEHELQPQP